MFHYDRIDLSEGIDLTKSGNSKECIVFHYWYFSHWFEFQNYFSNGCHDLMMLCLNFSDIAIITVIGVGYRCSIQDINKSDTIRLL